MKVLKADIAVIAIILLIIELIAVILNFSKANNQTVCISRGGGITEEYPLSINRNVTIEQEDRVNIIEIYDNKVRMKYSTCKNQICVHHAPMQAGESDAGEAIICLPNRISVIIK